MKNKSFRLFNIFLIMLFLITGCGTNSAQYHQPVQTQPLINTYKATEFRQPSNEREFLTLLSEYNVSRNDITEIINFLYVKPNGEWLEGEGIHSAARNLTLHFEKHAHDFKPPFRSEEAYHKAAMKAAASNDPDFEYFLDLKYYNNGLINVVKWNQKTKEFVVMRKDGRLATYFPDNTLTKGRFIRIPMDMKR